MLWKSKVYIECKSSLFFQVIIITMLVTTTIYGLKMDAVNFPWLLIFPSSYLILFSKYLCNVIEITLRSKQIFRMTFNLR